MTYPVDIVINDRNWYDSRIIESDPVVFQNVNYVTGDERSVNVVRQRFMQDWARRIIPNSIRQGVGLTDPAGGSDEIIVTQGYAIVAGRFLNIPTGTYDASIEGLTGSGGTPVLYYLVIRVDDGTDIPSTITEGDVRVPADEVAHLKAITLPYTKNHNELVIAKFRYNGSVIDQFEDYTAEQEWQASVISPVSVRPGLSTGSDNILIRAGASERIDNIGIETDKTRFYLNAVFNDQTASTEIKLINNNGILQIRDITDTAYLGQNMLNLSIGGAIILNTLNTGTSDLTNVGTINTFTIGGTGSGDFIDTDTIQTLDNKTFTSETIISSFWQDSIDGSFEITVPAINDTLVTKTSTDNLENKTLTSPIITGGTLNAGEPLTATSTEINQIITGHELGGIATGDIVDLESTQTLENKTLGSLKFWDADDSNFATITIPNLSANPVYDINKATSDTFLMEGSINTITGAKTFSTDNRFIMTGNVWSSATHIHDNNDQGGVLNINAATSGNLSLTRGGTNTSNLGSYDLIISNNSGSALTTISSPSSGRLLVSKGTTSYPAWEIPTITLTGTDLSGSASMNSSGDWSLNATVIDDEHSHSGAYISYNTEMQVPMTFIGADNDVNLDYLANYYYTMGGTGDSDNVMWVAPIPKPISGKLLYINNIKMYINGDDQNFITSMSIYSIDITKPPTQTSLYSSSTDRKTELTYEFDINNVISASHEYIFMKFNTIYSDYGQLRFSIPVISYHFV